MKNLITKKNAFYIDHIALGVSDTQVGMDYIEQLTGVRPMLPDGHNDAWYKSAALDLGNRSFLEVIGPNPEHKGFHPFKQILKELPAPKLVFWYVGTSDFSAAKQVIEKNGFKLERYSHIQKEKAGELIDYEIATVGKGFFSEQPCLIQWHSVPNRLEKSAEPSINSGCRIADFQVTFANATALNALFAKLGMGGFCVKTGDNHMQLSLETPKGLVTLEGGQLKFGGVSAVSKMFSLYKNHLLGRSR